MGFANSITNAVQRITGAWDTIDQDPKEAALRDMFEDRVVYTDSDGIDWRWEIDPLFGTAELSPIDETAKNPACSLMSLSRQDCRIHPAAFMER